MKFFIHIHSPGKREKKVICHCHQKQRCYSLIQIATFINRNNFMYRKKKKQKQNVNTINGPAEQKSYQDT
jgi:hypothetical protein